MNRSLLGIATLVMMTLAGTAEARPKHPPRPPRPPHAPRILRVTDPKAIRTIESDLKATTERAERDVETQLRRQVSAWLAEDGVPASWTPPEHLIRAMIVESIAIEPVQFHDLDVFKATCRADFSPFRKYDLVHLHGRQVAGRRMAVFGGILGFTLTCLAGVAGYIRLDEATRGYYTRPLRMLAAAGVGGAGVALYHVLT